MTARLASKVRTARVRKSLAQVRQERDELAARYVERRAAAASALLAEGKISAETVDHVSRVVALIGEELRQGFHDEGAGA